MDEQSEEFQRVVKKFYETIHEYHSKIKIIQVKKRMATYFYNRYLVVVVCNNAVTPPRWRNS